MIRLFKSRPTTKEFSENPEVLFDLSLDISEILVYGIKIGDNPNAIPFDGILTTTFEQNPEGVTRFQYSDNKTYYFIGDEKIEYRLEDRVNSVLTFGGIIHMKSGAKYVVKKNNIIGIGIHEPLVRSLQNISKKDIQRKFGKAERIVEDFEEIDGTLFKTEYYYDKRKILIIYDDWDKKILLINLGDFQTRE